MGELILKDYIASKVKKSKNNKFNLPNNYLKTLFRNIGSLILNENLYVLLLDNNWEIIDTLPAQLYDNFYNKSLHLNLNSTEEELSYHDNFFGKNVYIFSSSLMATEKERKYRICLLSESKNTVELKKMSDTLCNSLNNLMSYYNEEFENYHKLLNYLDAVDDGISACDSKGIVTYINESGCAILKSNKAEIVGKSLKSLTSDPILSKVLESQKIYQDQEYFINYKNENFHLMTSAYPVYNKDNDLIGAIDIFRRIKRSLKVATELAGYDAFYNFDDFIGCSRSLNNAIDLSKKFSHSNKNILITGESGTGKELFAQSIHNHSIRKGNPFVAINCASYPKDLFDSELFGYEEGAFTGAKKGGKTGKFELANGGSIFLDEIGEMPIHLQAKLLRVIETKTITRIGSNKNIDVDVRIIAATNRNLEEMVKNNSFRKDLYYRLKVLYIYLEPLRNREEDSVLLCNYFIKKFSRDYPKSIKGLNDEAINLVKRYKWPGNIRELENVISLALFYCNGDYITKEDLLNAGLKDVQEQNTNESNSDLSLSKVTRDIIIKTLEKNKGNKKKTAEELGISRSTLYRNID